MNENELLVLQIIKSNPFLSHQDIAEKLNMSSLALDNIISDLIKKGEIIGRAYVLPEKNFIFAIGGANIDRKFHIKGFVQHGTSNPATVTESVGGVARNIADNLGRLGNEVALITLFGQDQAAKTIKHESSSYINFDFAEYHSNYKTGSYSAVLDEKGELLLAMADMSIYDHLLPSILEKYERFITSARCIIVDLNCPKETISYLQNLACLRDTPLIIVPVSSPKMKNMPEDLMGVSYFICNKEEAETYLNTRIISNQDYYEGIKRLLEKGASNVIFTLGEKGVLYGNLNGIYHSEAINVEDILDVTGAGDAFVSGFIHGILNEETIENAIKFGQYNSTMTLQAGRTVRSDLTVDELNKWKNEQ